MSVQATTMPQTHLHLRGMLKRLWLAQTDVANIVFLDSPAFVGFSYSNTSSDAVVGTSSCSSQGVTSLQPARHCKQHWPQAACLIPSKKGCCCLLAAAVALTTCSQL